VVRADVIVSWNFWHIVKREKIRAFNAVNLAAGYPLMTILSPREAMTKTFDCVEMKRKAQERIYRETRGLSRDEELAYLHRAATEFHAEMKLMREEIANGRRTPPLLAGR
jgi:hypothetical protein